MDSFLAEELKPEVENLLKLKMELPEIGTGRRIDRIYEYIDSIIEDIEQKINDLPSEEHRRWDELNRVFLSLLDCP